MRSFGRLGVEGWGHPSSRPGMGPGVLVGLAWGLGIELAVAGAILLGLWLS